MPHLSFNFTEKYHHYDMVVYPKTVGVESRLFDTKREESSFFGGLTRTEEGELRLPSKEVMAALYIRI